MTRRDTWRAPEDTLRRALEALVQGGTLRGLIFTSFSFDPTFFEDNVLALLCNDGQRLSTPQHLHVASSWASAHGVAVFHDGRMLASPELRVTLDVFPITLPDGVFHPKIICALVEDDEGDTTIRLLVTSGNLSWSGWGHNREVFAAATVAHRATALPLRRLLTWLGDRCPDSRDRLDPFLAALSQLANTPPAPARRDRLIVTLPDDSDDLTVVHLLAKTHGALTIAAPFFHPNLHRYLAEHLPGRPILLAPAPREGREEVNIARGVIAALDRAPEVTFGRLTPDGDRHDHLKAYRWEGDAKHPGGVLLGSHNATEAALGGGGGPRNVEVSVALDGVALPFEVHLRDQPPLGVAEPATLIPDWATGAALHLDVRVLVDWRRDLYLIALADPPDDLNRLRIDLPGRPTEPLGALLRPSPDGPLVGELPLTEVATLTLMDRKWFRVRREGGEPSEQHVGLIHELHWLEARPSFALGSLDRCLEAWLHDDLTDPRRAALAGAPRRLADEEEGDPAALAPYAAQGDVFSNFFALFRARTRFLKRLAPRDDEPTTRRARRAMASLKGAPDSLLHVVQHAAARYPEDTDWDAYGFTLTTELRHVHRAAADLVEHPDLGLEPLRESVITPCDAALARLEAQWRQHIDRHLADLESDAREAQGIQLLVQVLTTGALP